MTEAAPAPPAGTAAGSLWQLPAMRLLVVYTVTGFTGFTVTLASLPTWLVGRGTAESLAGLTTTVMLVLTVATQLLVPRLVQRVGLGPVLSGGLIALGAPSLLLLIDGGLGWVLAICAVRGIGFGSLTVLGSTMVARVVPVARRGEAIGIYGLAIAIPNLLGIPGGVALVSAGHFLWVAILGAAPVLGLVSARALTRVAAVDPDVDPDVDPAVDPDVDSAVDPAVDPGTVPDLVPSADPNMDAVADPSMDPAPDSVTVADPGTNPAADPDQDPAGERARRSRRAAGLAAVGPSVVLLVVTLAGGGFSNFLPIARPEGALATTALLVWGVTGALARWRAGLLADRRGIGRLLPASSAVTVIGMAIVVAGLVAGPGPLSWAVTLIGSAVLGVGYGGSQNLTLVAAFARARQRETATVSSIWNVGFDTGTALGAALVGAMAAGIQIPGALAVTAALVAVSIPLAVRSGRRPAAPTAPAGP